jgi:DNA-binding transcriptional LysR family regulator
MNIEPNFFYKNNRLQQLRGFVATMQLGTVTAAANTMGLTQATVSLQIKSLEDDLKIKLFTRKGPHIKPTKDGTLLYELALPHIKSIEDIENIFTKYREKKYNEVIKIAANNSSLNFILPKLLKKYIDENTNVNAEVFFAEFYDGLDKLEKNEIDVLLLPRREHLPIPKHIDYVPLFKFKPVLLTRPDHPLCGKKNITVKQIAEYDFTLPAKGLHVIPNLHDIFEAAGIKKEFRVQFKGWEVTRKFIEAGLVISITADIVLEKKDVLVGTSLSHLFPDVDYGFYLKKGMIIPDKINRLVKIAKSYKGDIR